MSSHSDQGRNYESEIFRELCEMLNIRKTRTSPRNPKCNGQAERFNRTLIRMIRAFLKGEQGDWDLHLACLASAYQATPYDTTGLTPNLVMLGCEVRLPYEVVCGTGLTPLGAEVQSYGEYLHSLKAKMCKAHKITCKHCEKSAERAKSRYDSSVSLYKYKDGDLVWVLNESQKRGCVQSWSVLMLGLL